MLNGLGGTFFKQLADGRWACFFLFGGKKGRILPSEATGWLIRRVSGTSALLGASVLLGLAIFWATYLLGALWLRRRYRQLPVTEEPLSTEETVPESRATVWCVFMGTVAMSFGAGYFLALNDPSAVRILGLGLGAVGIFAVILNRLLIAAHR